MEGLDVALDVEQRCSQLVGDIADETALGSIELHFTGQVLHRDSNAFQRFTTAITHGLKHQPQGAAGLLGGAAHLCAVPTAAEHGLQWILQFHP